MTEKSTVNNLTLFSIVGIVAIVAVVGLLQTTGTTTYAQPAQVTEAPAVSSSSVSGGSNTVGQFGASNIAFRCGMLTAMCESSGDPGLCMDSDTVCGRT